jgi:L-alanine-DL-glutamate epimerase-like enolase superfamily enzyme
MCRRDCDPWPPVNLCWIEEPVAAYDHAGCAEVALESRTPIQIGESYRGPHDMAKDIRGDTEA